MGKVCRILKSENINQSKYDELSKQAEMLGALRKEVWHRFGSIDGSSISFRKLRNEWVKNRDFSPLPAKAWKETLRDVLDDIKMYEEAAKLKVRQDIAKRTTDKEERKRLYNLLKGNDWPSDSYLSRKMRKYKKHGRTTSKIRLSLKLVFIVNFKVTMVIHGLKFLLSSR